jgi:hypothetical protein
MACNMSLEMGAGIYLGAAFLARRRRQSLILDYDRFCIVLSHGLHVPLLLVGIKLTGSK